MKHRSARTVAAVLVAVLLPLGSGTGAGAVASPEVVAASTIGAAGAGDPYFPLDGNGGYDVAAYTIRDRYHFDTHVLSGRTAIQAHATQVLTRFDLDLLLTPRSVRVNGVAAHFRKASTHELQVWPAHPIAAGSPFSVAVTYAGRPGRIGYAGEHNFLAANGEVAAVNQPHMAPWWFAANDHPRDKARYDITLVVPRGKQVLSNGRLLSTTRTRTTTAYHWRPRDPMASYQAFFVAGSFVLDTGTINGLRYRNAVSRKLSAARIRAERASLHKTVGLVGWLQRQLGAYPFEITGGVRTALPLGFSLETQTRPVYAENLSTSLMVHELAHQWLGDSVGLRRWRDIWLNEGMATWMEWRYREATRVETAQARLLREYNSAPDELWTLPIGDPGPANLFDWAVYERGAMTLQALRHRIGEHDFWVVLRGWVALHRNGTATTEDLEALTAQVTGLDLTSFWDAWLVSPTRPAPTSDNGLA